jgi:hypothetical protein
MEGILIVTQQYINISTPLEANKTCSSDLSIRDLRG